MSFHVTRFAGGPEFQEFIDEASTNFGRQLRMDSLYTDTVATGITEDFGRHPNARIITAGQINTVLSRNRTLDEVTLFNTIIQSGDGSLMEPVDVTFDKAKIVPRYPEAAHSDCYIELTLEDKCSKYLLEQVVGAAREVSNKGFGILPVTMRNYYTAPSGFVPHRRDSPKLREDLAAAFKYWLPIRGTLMPATGQYPR